MPLRVRLIQLSLAALSLAAVVLGVLSLTCAPAHADDRWSLAGAVGGDAWVTPESFGHAFALFSAVRDDTLGGRLRIHYNTETLHLGLEGVRLADGAIELGIAARGEGGLAGLSTDYYRRGLRIEEFGYFSSYLWLLPSLKWHPARYHSLELVPAARRWFFARRDTDAQFILPPDAWVFEPELRYTFWDIDAPSKEWEAHRLFPRITGLAAGITGAMQVRSDVRQWGAVTSTAAPRNDPESVSYLLSQWARAGVEVGSRLRFQVEERFAWGWHQDDLYRLRVGGLTPYVVPIPGLPWAAILSDRLVAAQASAHVAVDEDGQHEVGLAVAGGAFNDIRRQGDLDDLGAAGGLSLLADLRFGSWQVDARAGWAFPTSFQADPPHLSGLLVVGKRFR